MKKIFLILTLSALTLIGMNSCGSKTSEKNSDEAKTEAETSSDSSTLTASPENASQEYAQFVAFDQPAKIGVKGKMIDVDVPVTIKSAAGKINDNDNTELILLDESGAKVASLHPFGKSSSFEDALFSGEKGYDTPLTFITSFDSEEKANEAVANAKSYKIIMPLAERVVVENKFPDWNPVGTYEIEDKYGTVFTLVLKKGGSADLTNPHGSADNDAYTFKGSWSQSNDEGYVVLDFFSGPFMGIGSHEFITRPVLTPDYFYYDDDAYHEDTDCLAVKKVE